MLWRLKYFQPSVKINMRFFKKSLPIFPFFVSKLTYCYNVRIFLISVGDTVIEKTISSGIFYWTEEIMEPTLCW
jgi:hypothetical protein